jgi:hypothetical protein
LAETSYDGGRSIGNDGNRPIAASGAQTNGVGPNPPAILGGAVGG